jgi:hypothetical protein
VSEIEAGTGARARVRAEADVVEGAGKVCSRRGRQVQSVKLSNLLQKCSI